MQNNETGNGKTYEKYTKRGGQISGKMTNLE
jgi:hypothetical protein